MQGDAFQMQRVNDRIRAQAGYFGLQRGQVAPDAGILMGGIIPLAPIGIVKGAVLAVHIATVVLDQVAVEAAQRIMVQRREGARQRCPAAGDRRDRLRLGRGEDGGPGIEGQDRERLALELLGEDAALEFVLGAAADLVQDEMDRHGGIDLADEGGEAAGIAQACEVRLGDDDDGRGAGNRAGVFGEHVPGQVDDGRLVVLREQFHQAIERRRNCAVRRVRCADSRIERQRRGDGGTRPAQHQRIHTLRRRQRIGKRTVGLVVERERGRAEG